MSPTVRVQPPTTVEDPSDHARTPLVASVYAFALLAAALGTFVVLVATGQRWPSPGPVLLLAIPLALCMNRFVFFPNEIGVTADAAVIFTAIVAFQHDAAWLGPLLVALLVGPLDARHWNERAFVRMAYNSGSTALVTCAALVVFDALTRAFGSSWSATVVAAAGATVPYVLGESVLGVALVSLLGERPRAAFRHQLPLNAVAFPLALLGTAAGLAAVDLGCWVTFLVLVPAPLVPELLVVVAPRKLGTARSVTAGLVATGLTCLGLSSVSPDSTARAIAGLLGLACLVFVENPPRRSSMLPPLAAVLVVVPVGIYTAAPATVVVASAAAAGVAYLAVAVRWDRRAWWATPIAGFAAGLAAIAGTLGAGAGDLALVTVAMLGGLVLAAAWGPLPWTSRVAGPFAADCLVVGRRPVLAAVAIATIVLPIVATSTPDTTRTVLALITVTLIELEVMMIVLAERLWRFSPRRRLVELGIAAGVGAGAVAVVLPLTENGAPLAAAGSAACGVAIVAVARQLVPSDTTRSSVERLRRRVPR